MDVPTAKQEIRYLIENGKLIPTKAEKEAYMNRFLKELSGRDEEERIRANFFALMEMIEDLYEEVMGFTPSKK